MFRLRQHCFLVTQHGMGEKGDGRALKKASAGMGVRAVGRRRKKKQEEMRIGLVWVFGVKCVL